MHPTINIQQSYTVGRRELQKRGSVGGVEEGTGARLRLRPSKGGGAKKGQGFRATGWVLGRRPLGAQETEAAVHNSAERYICWTRASGSTDGHLLSRVMQEGRMAQTSQLGGG